MKRDWNHTIGAAGVPGTGKSTWSLQRILALQRERTAYAVVYEGGGKFPRTGLDGMRLSFVHEHSSVAAAKRRFAEDPRGIHIVHPADDESELVKVGRKDELLTGGLLVAKLAVDLARVSGKWAVWWADEISFVDGARSPGGYSPWFRQRIATRRHDRVAYGYSTQRPKWAHPDLRTTSTEMAIFRVSSKLDLKALNEGLVPAQALTAIAAQKDFEFRVFT